MPSTTADRRVPQIAVIGGGISGLAAAHRLTEQLAQPQITLFESSGRLGGVLETVRRDGFLIERSADNFLTTRPAGVALCQRLGIAGDLLPTDETRRRAFVVREGRLQPVPAGFYLMSPERLGPILKSPILSPLGKLRLLAEPLVPPRGRSTEQGAGSREENNSGIPAAADESVASFVRRRLGREVYERLVQPLVAGIYTADAEHLSMAATMPQFLSQERQFGSLRRAALRSPKLLQDSAFRDSTVLSAGTPHSALETASGARYSIFVAPRDGMGSLIVALADRLPPGTVRLRTRITRITRAADTRWRLESADAAAELFDAVIIALPAPAAAKLLEAFDLKLAAELAAIRYVGCAVVSCAFRRAQIAHLLDGFGFVVPQIERRRIVAASFANHKFPGRAPDDCLLIRTFVGGSLEPELAELPDDAIRRLVLDELGDLLAITGLPQWMDIARWPASMPQYHVGHLARVARIERLAARWPGLALAGNAYHGVGIPQCIASGEAAAERIVARIT